MLCHHARRPTRPRPTALTVHPTALFSILDHYLRRTDQQPRVIGTLLGTRPSPSTVNVTHAFAVLHSETEEQVAVDMDYHRSMFDMFVRGRGEGNKEPIGIVGWYATGGEEKQVARPHGQPQGQGQKGLGTYSALIHNFYGQETAPYPAVHVSLDTGTEEGVGAGVRAYVGCVVLLLTANIHRGLYEQLTHRCFSETRKLRVCTNPLRIRFTRL